MAYELPIYPTHSEAQALASLATNPSSEPLSGIQYFHELLRVLRDPSCSRFLFASDPIELQHLVHPQLPQFAVTNEMSETSVEPNSSPQDSLSDHWSSRHFTFPAYSSDGKTFGFVVSKDIYIPGSAWGLEPTKVETLTTSRFVKHDEEGYTVLVANYAEFNAYRLEYSKMITNTRQVRFIVAVDANIFQGLLLRGSLFVKDMMAALLFMQMSTEHRKCPDCRLSADECFCEAPVVKPRHPFDYEAFRKCTLGSGGVFEGRTTVALFAAGVKIRGGALGCLFVSRPKFDFDLVEGLRRLAITKHVGGETARHSNLKLFADAARNMRQAYIRNRVTSSSEAALGGLLLSDVGTVSQTLNLATEPVAVNSLLPLVGEEEGNLESVDMNITPSLIDTLLVPSVQSGTFGGAMNISEEDVVGTQAVDVVTPDAEDAFGSHEHTSRTEEFLAGDVESVETDSLSIRKNNEEKVNADDRIRRLKVELRKERNRACAQRSNMRKKVMMDALKNDIKTTREKADLLRSQEMLLRRQNIFLKKQVADKYVAGR